MTEPHYWQQRAWLRSSNIRTWILGWSDYCPNSNALNSENVTKMSLLGTHCSSTGEWFIFIRKFKYQKLNKLSLHSPQIKPFCIKLWCFDETFGQKRSSSMSKINLNQICLKHWLFCWKFQSCIDIAFQFFLTVRASDSEVQS